jgi:hypothetical protein
VAYTFSKAARTSPEGQKNTGLETYSGLFTNWSEDFHTTCNLLSPQQPAAIFKSSSTGLYSLAVRLDEDSFENFPIHTPRSGGTVEIMGNEFEPGKFYTLFFLFFITIVCC